MSLEEMQREETETEQTRQRANDAEMLSKKYNSLRPEAESSQKGYLSLRGLHSWSTRSLAGKSMSFMSIGGSQNTSLSLIYDITKQNSREDTKICFDATITTETKKPTRKYHPSIAAFLEICVNRFVHKVSECSLTAASQIGQHMQKFVWSMGRLDQTASELQSLMRRYKAKLVQHGDQTFVFTVDFETKSSKLAVDFEIDLSYPSLPLEVQLDLLQGFIDLDNLRKALVKNAKPGFGNLSRACDVIAASLS